MGKLDHNQVFDFVADDTGSVLVETTVIFPMLATLTYGLVTLGFLMNTYVTLASATSAAARQFALDAPVAESSLSATPYTDLEGQLSAPANNGLLEMLNPVVALQPTGGITITSVCVYPAGSGCGGNTCNSDVSCATLLANAQNDVVTVQTTYPCFVAIPLFGLNSCTLAASATFAIQ